MHWVWEVAGRTLGKEKSICQGLEAKGSTTLRKQWGKNPVFLSCGVRRWRGNWRNCNPCVLLVGMENDAAAMENGSAFLQKIENRVTIWSSSSTSGELKAGTPRDSTVPLFVAGLFAGAKWWKQPKCASKDEWINKMWYIHVTEYYSALKKKEILTHYEHGWTLKTLC